MEHYWQLKQYSGEVTYIPPQYVATVKRRWRNGQPIDLGNNGTLAASSIEDFRPSNRPYTNQQLLESAAQVFNEPVLADDGAIKARWVKKAVSQGWYEKYYSRIPSYQKIGDEEGNVIIAFRLPVHEIDVSQGLQYCSDDDVKKLTHQ